MKIEDVIQRLAKLKIAGQPMCSFSYVSNVAQYRWFFGETFDLSLIVVVKQFDNQYNFSVRTNPTNIESLEWMPIDDNFKFEDLVEEVNKAMRFQLLMTLKSLSRRTGEVLQIITSLDN